MLAERKAPLLLYPAQATLQLPRPVSYPMLPEQSFPENILVDAYTILEGVRNKDTDVPLLRCCCHRAFATRGGVYTELVLAHIAVGSYLEQRARRVLDGIKEDLEKPSVLPLVK